MDWSASLLVIIVIEVVFYAPKICTVAKLAEILLQYNERVYNLVKFCYRMRMLYCYIMHSCFRVRPNKVSNKNLLFCAFKEVRVGIFFIFCFWGCGSKLTFLKMNMVSFTVYLVILLKCGGGNRLQWCNSAGSMVGALWCIHYQNLTRSVKIHESLHHRGI